jgi:hypothetical protein
MDLQNIYYLVAILLMLLSVIFVLGCIAFLVFFYLMIRSAKNNLKQAKEKFSANAAKASNFTGIAMFIGSKILQRIKKSAEKK